MKVSIILTSAAVIQGSFVYNIDRRAIQSTTDSKLANDFGSKIIQAQDDKSTPKQDLLPSVKIDNIPKELSKKIKELFESEQAKALALPPVELDGQVEAYRNYVKQSFAGAFNYANDTYQKALKSGTTGAEPSYETILKDFLAKAQKYSFFSAKNDVVNFEKSFEKYIGTYYKKYIEMIESKK